MIVSYSAQYFSPFSLKHILAFPFFETTSVLAGQLPSIRSRASFVGALSHQVITARYTMNSYVKCAR